MNRFREQNDREFKMGFQGFAAQEKSIVLVVW
jgi:hypothetical protein